MRDRRKAFTLIEMLVVMGVFSALFGTVLLLLYAMFRTSGGLSDAVAQTAQQQRLAAQLRSDAHESLEAKLTAPPESSAPKTILQLSLADGRVIEYRLQQEHVERRLRVDDTVSSIDTYGVLPVIDRGWSLDEQPAGGLLTVYLHQHRNSGLGANPRPHPLAVKAALGVACLRTASGLQAAATP